MFIVRGIGALFPSNQHLKVVSTFPETHQVHHRADHLWHASSGLRAQ
jgi:hypothetical protein